MSYYTDEFVNYDKKRIIVNWSEELWDAHVNKHPSLLTRKNTSKLITEALGEPSLVYEGKLHGRETTLCYYKEHKRHQNDIYHTKVVVGCATNPFYVKSVFQKWANIQFAVKELNYPQNFKEIWRHAKTYL